jgi:hypothetical protein
MATFETELETYIVEGGQCSNRTVVLTRERSGVKRKRRKGKDERGKERERGEDKNTKMKKSEMRRRKRR